MSPVYQGVIIVAVGLAEIVFSKKLGTIVGKLNRMKNFTFPILIAIFQGGILIYFGVEIIMYNLKK